MDPSGHGTHEEHRADPPVDHEGHTRSEGAKQLGLSITDGGLRLDAYPAIVSAGEETEFSFAIVGSDGRPVTTFKELHERRMHLVIVLRDLSGFQHQHPTMAGDGTWSTSIVFPAGGAWRAFADFATATGPSTLGLDVLVEGEFRPEPLPTPNTRADIKDEVVSLDTAHGGSELRFTVTRDGRSVESSPISGLEGISSRSDGETWRSSTCIPSAMRTSLTRSPIRVPAPTDSSSNTRSRGSFGPQRSRR